MGFRVLHHLNTGNIKGIPEEAKWAEGVGYDGLCTEETGHDPLLPLMLAATTTSRVNLETRVAIAFPRSPMVFAYSAMDLQNFSGGRFRLGLGTQVKGHIERRFSVQWASPGPRIREYVQSLHAIWDAWQNGTRLAFHGDHYNFSLMTPFFSPGPSDQPRPPVFISAVNAYNCRVAGEVCDGVSLHPLTSPKFITEKVVPHIADGASRTGRDQESVNLSGSGFIITGPNRSVIKERKTPVRRQIAFYASTRTYTTVLETHGFEDVGVRLHEMSLKGQWDEMTGLITDEIFDAFAIAAGYDEVAAAVKERYDGLLDEVVFGFETKGPDDEGQLKKIIQELQE
jgi:probable F420-dependent oxidoreductase